MKVYKNEHLMICFDDCSNSSCGIHFIFGCDECQNVLLDILHALPLMSENTEFEILKYTIHQNPSMVKPIVKTKGIKKILKILSNLHIDTAPYNKEKK